MLSAFRARVVAGGAEQRLFEALLTHAKTRGWLKARGRQRTDSTHVLAAMQSLSRLECVAETLRHARHVLATVEPTWLQAWVPREWFERSATRWEDYRLPSGREERQALAEMIGREGRRLLLHLSATPSPIWLRELPAIVIVRQVWIQQCSAEPEHAHWREAKDLPPSSLLICTPSDAEARYSQKRSLFWTGYKVQVTERGDEDGPHLVTDVQTTPAPVSDFDMTPPIQAALAQRDLLPNEQVLDAG